MKTSTTSITSLAIFSIVFFGCKKEQIEIPAVPEVIVAETSAVYSLRFEGNWSLANQPTEYPVNAHFSPLVGLVHNSRTEVIRLDRIASPGIKTMAESGRTSPLSIELGNVISNGDGAALIIADNGLANGIESWTGRFSVNTTQHLISLVSMLAPSPDWFVGISNVDLYDGTRFLDKLTLDMTVYDAGTDSGNSFTSSDSVTSPVVNVFKLLDSPIGNGTEVSKPFARIILTKELRD